MGLIDQAREFITQHATAIIVSVLAGIIVLLLEFVLRPFRRIGHFIKNIFSLSRRVEKLEARADKAFKQCPQLPDRAKVKERSGMMFRLEDPFSCFCLQCYHVDHVYNAIRRAGPKSKFFNCNRCKNHFELTDDDEAEIRRELGIPQAK